MERTLFPVSWCIRCGATFIATSGVRQWACGQCAATIRIDEPGQLRPPYLAEMDCEVAQPDRSSGTIT